MIDPQELFDRVKQLWPAEVSILENEQNDIYWSLEKRLGDDDWMQVAAWSFHQALEKCAKEAFAQGKEVLLTSSVTVDDFDANVRKNLKHESWSADKPLYGSLGLKH
ncbi:hypothetical protein DM806_04615 [Sphingobium lactosutens]|uniref:hypothetical protein n=1 Tax=Sphingobium lactosutens TaxID=522773 RepID=UPI0015BF4B32|nr:hypothetical protein [Sphingobium lactosutens]NWK94963.1 hypothetical protein [Sphingobium lactosutens]